MRVPADGSAFGAPVHAQPWARRERDLLRRLVALGEELVRASGRSAPAADAGRFAEGPAAVVAALVRACVVELERPAGPDGADTAALARLVAALELLAAEVHEHELERRRHRLTDCAVALDVLGRIPTAAGLVDAVCAEAVQRLGFGLAVLWWGEGPERRAAAAFGDAGDPEPGPPGLPSGGPVDPRGAGAVAVEAQIVVRGEVVGALGAGRARAAGEGDELDREVLAVLAAGFGRISERAVVHERLILQREHVRDELTKAERLVDELLDAEILLDWSPADVAPTAGGGGTTGAPGSDRGAPDQVAGLTDRQREILDLMATGATNAVIAERLSIAEGTVKTHVKRILRRLGAVDRSQAIARYLGVAWSPGSDMRPPTPGSGGRRGRGARRRAATGRARAPCGGPALPDRTARPIRPRVRSTRPEGGEEHAERTGLLPLVRAFRLTTGVGSRPAPVLDGEGFRPGEGW